MRLEYLFFVMVVLIFSVKVGSSVATARAEELATNVIVSEAEKWQYWEQRKDCIFVNERNGLLESITEKIEMIDPRQTHVQFCEDGE